MRKAAIYRNGKLAGFLTEESRDKYFFRYEDTYFVDNLQPSVSLTLPKTQQEYQSEYLFPFFFNMLSEGVNRKLQCTQLRIDENDNFGLLLATAQQDTIGAITVKPIEE
ncbi:MAG: HipA N-terminal domain-containing protein [Dysgonamonadaceae bacterium]|jgi:serine/threonine-protein kinase HipA|nr:HipA N-terminal domain-containing protein [Dysgonamonadaceae bacterium]